MGSTREVERYAGAIKMFTSARRAIKMRTISLSKESDRYFIDTNFDDPKNMYQSCIIIFKLRYKCLQIIAPLGCYQFLKRFGLLFFKR
jgi:hypothetical protein